MTARLTPLIHEIKRGSLTEEGVFSGYASTWGGPPDAHGDIIERGAFLNAISKHIDAGTMPAMLWSHDLKEPVGTWLSIREDDKGLLVEGKLSLGTTRGAEAYSLMKDGALSMSIGFVVAPDGTEKRGSTRYITDIFRLAEVSLVAIPANHYAQITEVKNRPVTVQEFKDALRSMGFSNSESKFVTTNGFREFLAPRERSPIDLLTQKVDAVLRILENGNEHRN
ncbi:HK97 family phage prohead protease [Haliea sp. E17]|uniref:HK97 family phage prohead protease n=1 Tax=Haliea sp. E17 TaxID=3401576 RepID=UPI003AAC1653